MDRRARPSPPPDRRRLCRSLLPLPVLPTACAGCGRTCCTKLCSCAPWRGAASGCSRTALPPPPAPRRLSPCRVPPFPSLHTSVCFTCAAQAPRMRMRHAAAGAPSLRGSLTACRRPLSGSAYTACDTEEGGSQRVRHRCIQAPAPQAPAASRRPHLHDGTPGAGQHAVVPRRQQLQQGRGGRLPALLRRCHAATAPPPALHRTCPMPSSNLKATPVAFQSSSILRWGRQQAGHVGAAPLGSPRPLRRAAPFGPPPPLTACRA